MKFYQETITGDLILIKTNIPTPPPCPVIARSATPKQSPALLIRFVLWLAAFIGPLPTLELSPLTKARFALLIIIGLAAVEVLAQSHIEKSLGVVT